jgi:hypothetical protein
VNLARLHAEVEDAHDVRVRARAQHGVGAREVRHQPLIRSDFFVDELDRDAAIRPHAANGLIHRFEDVPEAAPADALVQPVTLRNETIPRSIDRHGLGVAGPPAHRVVRFARGQCALR